MAATSSIEFSVPAAMASVRSIRDKVAEIATRAGAHGQVLDDIRLCVSEAVANAVQHAYGWEQGPVQVTIKLARDELIVVVRDDGVGLTEAQRRGSEGYGLKIIDMLTQQHVIRSEPRAGTEVRMSFALHEPAPGIAGLRAA